MAMEQPYRPRVSRETRLLLATSFLALATLWLLARVRFPERPVTPNPVPPLLTQLAAGPDLSDLAAEVAQVQARLQSSLVVFDRPSGSSPTGVEHVPALRIRDDAAVVMLDDGNATPRAGRNAIAVDRASRLALVHVPYAPAAALTAWSAQRLQQPRYVLASAASPESVSLRPVFVSSLVPSPSLLWSGQIWRVPPHTDLVEGTFVFTVDGALAGLVTRDELGAAVVPAEMLLARAARLFEQQDATPGDIGVTVQPLTANIADATGARAGVIVAWVDPRGAAAQHLAIGDVIEAVDGTTIASSRDWQARTASVASGSRLTLQVRRRGAVQTVTLTAAALPPASVPSTLGLTLRRHRLGALVVAVDEGSAAETGGMKAGDIVTTIGGVERPTPAQVARTFAQAPDDRPILVAVTRGTTHLLTTIER